MTEAEPSRRAARRWLVGLAVATILAFGLPKSGCDPLGVLSALGGGEADGGGPDDPDDPRARLGDGTSARGGGSGSDGAAGNRRGSVSTTGERLRGRRGKTVSSGSRRGAGGRADRRALSRSGRSDDDDDDDDDDDWEFDDDDIDGRDDDDSARWDDDDSAGDDDDDDSAEGDDDDDSAEGDDDDDSAEGDDDDDSAGDDDDDSAGDDDDSAAPWDEFLDRTYCLDWDSADIVQPPALELLLNFTGTELSNFPLLAAPIDADFSTGEIWFLGGLGLPEACLQDSRWATARLPESTGSWYSEPEFEVLTTRFVLWATTPPLTIYELRLIGEFSADAMQIQDSMLIGRLDVTAFEDFACDIPSWTCYPCGQDGVATCVDLVVTNATWNDNGTGEPINEILQ